MPRAKQVWDKYAVGVIEGKIPANNWVRLACKRYKNDKLRCKKRGCPIKWDEAAALEAIGFFRLLKHSKGTEWLGMTFELGPWQQFIVANIFGWKRRDGTRRFRTAHVAVPKKNGKTTLLAGIGLYGLCCDNEAGAEIYAAATKEDQAKLVWEEAKAMVLRSAQLNPVIKKTHNALLIVEDRCIFKPLGGDSETQDGLNVHMGIVDELHQHPNKNVWDIVARGTAARMQPLMFAITTAGYNKTCFCRTQQEMGEKILLGLLPEEQSDSWFFYMAGVDPGDELKWDDEEVWRKANPNLGVSIKIESLREACNEAKMDPGAVNGFLTKSLNIWTQQENRWMPMDKWALCAGRSPDVSSRKLREEMIAKLRGRTCYAGMDIAETNDLSAVVLVFPPVEDEMDGNGKITTPGDPSYTVLPFFWCPKDDIQKRATKDRVPYDVWERDGFLIATDGAVTDQAFIRERIKALKDVFKMKELGFDPWHAKQLGLELAQAGISVVEVRQGPASLSEPMNLLMSLTIGAKLRHLDNPVMNWMADNIVHRKDANGNIAPDKEKAREKIDGIVALIIALSRVVANAATKKAAPRIFVI